jgi:glutamin-(asparagin-)ase
MSLPRLTVLAMGGTIAGSAASSTDPTGYRAGTTGVSELLAALPELDEIATLTGEQFAQIDSSDLTDELLLGLARRAQELLAQDDVDGLVITHGTDTLEETAYLLHLVLSSAKPVVLVGSMRPPTALSPDGPRNIFAAVTVAVSADAHGRGVLVVMNDEIHTARDVSKSSSLRVDSFESPYGPLGAVVDGRAVFYRSVARPHTGATEFDLARIDSLPRAAIVFAHSGLDAAFVESLAGYDVIVHAGFGNGTVAERIVAALGAARASGTLIVRATRTGSGHVTRVGASADEANTWVAVDDQNPQRARILASLALTVTRDPAEIQRIFHRY